MHRQQHGPGSGERHVQSLRWHVAATLSRKEDLALGQLVRQGFKTFMPRFRKPWRHARRQGVRLAPLFPGYVFVAFDPETAPWRSINGTFGVQRLIGSGDAPQSVPDGFMRKLMARCEGNVLASLVEELEPGVSVRIMSGPFADRLAVIERLDDQARVTVLLEVMGAQARLRLPSSQLAPG